MKRQNLPTGEPPPPAPTATFAARLQSTEKLMSTQERWDAALRLAQEAQTGSDLPAVGAAYLLASTTRGSINFDEAQRLAQQAEQVFATLRSLPGQVSSLGAQLLSATCGGKAREQITPLRSRLVELVFGDTTRPIGSFLAATRTIDLLAKAAQRTEALALTDALQRALDTDQRAPLLRARLWHELGRAQLPLALYDNAILSGQASLELLKDLPTEGVLAALVKNTLGVAHWRRSENTIARRYLEESLAALEALAPRTILHADALHNITLVPDKKDPESSYRRLLLAEEIYTQLNAVTPGRISILNSLGHFFWGRGELDTAKRYIRAALELVEPGTRQGDLHTVFGDVCLAGGERKAAREHYEIAKTIYETFAPGTFFVGRGFNNLGGLEQLEGNHVLAKQYFERALAIYKVTQPNSIEEASASRDLGSALELLGELSAAERHYQESLALVGRLDAHNYQRTIAVAQTARFWMRHSRFQEAIRLLLPFANYLESFLPLYRSEALRPLAARDVAGIYVELLRCYVAVGDTAQAFYVQERLRAYDLLHLYAESSARNKTPLAAPLKDKLASIDAQVKQRLKLLEAAKTPSEKDTCRRDLDRLTIRFSNEVKQEQRKPLKPFTQVKAQRLLEPGSLLLSYTLYGETLTICGVTRSSIRTHQVPTANIPQQAQALWRAVVSISPRYAGREVQTCEELASALYKTLIAPFEHEVATAKRLILCPDGAIHKVPFAALLGPKGFLGHRYPLSYIPSMTLFSQMQRHKLSIETQANLVYADPELPPLPTGPDEIVSAERSGLPKKRLPYAREEGLQIAKLLKTQLRTDDEASLSRFRKECKNARIIHLASHAFANEADPLASWILFSPKRGADYQLRAWELYARSLSLSAAHVTLASCESSLGAAVEIEGAFSLTRAFLAAGASSVLGSLWRLNDPATAVFMKAFYEALQKGERRDRAVLLATREVSEKSPWKHPYYWAAFQLVGSAEAIQSYTPAH